MCELKAQPARAQQVHGARTREIRQQPAKESREKPRSQGGTRQRELAGPQPGAKVYSQTQWTEEDTPRRCGGRGGSVAELGTIADIDLCAQLVLRTLTFSSTTSAARKKIGRSAARSSPTGAARTRRKRSRVCRPVCCPKGSRRHPYAGRGQTRDPDARAEARRRSARGGRAPRRCSIPPWRIARRAGASPEDESRS